MIKGKLEDLKKLTLTHTCPEHKTGLAVVWLASENDYVIRCGAGEYPEELVKNLTPTQVITTDPGIDIPELASRLPKADLATGQALSEAQVQGLRRYAQKYGLDPYRGHVAMMYGEPYFTIDAYLFHANQEKIPFNLGCMPLDENSRKMYKIGEEDHAWIATLKRLDTGATFTGMGIVTQEEMTETSKKDKSKLRSPVVAEHPWQMAQKRAEWQVLRRAFPIGREVQRLC